MDGHQAILNACLLLAQTEPVRQSAVRQWWWLWLGLVVLCFLLVRVVVALGKRRQHAAELDPKGKKRAIKDAWEEAGKRAEAPPPGEDEDDSQESKEP